MTQHLTLNEVKAAATQAYTDGRLIAQGDWPRGLEFSNPRNGRCCAIGAVLDAEAIAEINAKNLHCGGAPLLVTHEVISIAEEDKPALYAIQAAHDAWSCARDPDERCKLRDRFLMTIS